MAENKQKQKEIKLPEQPPIKADDCHLTDKKTQNRRTRQGGHL